MEHPTYIEQIATAFDRFADNECLVAKRDGIWTTRSYREVRREIGQLASSLDIIGFGTDCNAVVVGDNTPEWVIAYHAIICAGGRVVPLDPNLPSNDMYDIIRTVSPRVIFCDAPFVPLFKECGDFLKNTTIICLSDNSSYSSFVKTGNPKHDPFSRLFKPDDVISLLFTSGTTGKSKGAMLTAGNYATAGREGPGIMELTDRDRMLAVLPLYHVFGFAACITAMLSGGMAIILVPQVNGRLIMEALNEQKATVLCAVPRLLVLMAGSVADKVSRGGIAAQALFGALFALSKTFGPIFGRSFSAALFSKVHASFGGHLRTIVSGGAALDKKTYAVFRQMGFNIVEGYGLTETFGPITLCPPHGWNQGTIGLPLPPNEVKIANPDANGIGEILLRGPCVFAGYYGDPEATRAVFDDEGWFHSGDLGTIDKRGFIRLTGRAKSVIVLDSGKNVHPEELEEFYSASRMFEEIAVFGLKTGTGEKVAAIVVPSAEIRHRHTPADAQRIIAAEISRLSADRPTYLRIAETAVSFTPLPRTSTRKIRIAELPALFAAAQSGSSVVKQQPTAGDRALMQTPLFGYVSEAVRSCAPNRAVTIVPSSHLAAEIGIDSLGFLSVLTHLEEQHGIRLSHEAGASCETVGDLYHAAEKAAETGPVAPMQSPEIDWNSLVAGRDSFAFRSVAGFARSIAKGMLDASVNGTERIPADRPVILASNHQSIIDIMLIWQALPDAVRAKSCAIGKAELMSNPIFHSLAKSVNFIPIKRESDAAEALRLSIAALDKGYNIIIFPEGTRTRDGFIGTFRGGIGRLMRQTGAPVVPIRISGAYELWPRTGGPAFDRIGKTNLAVTFGSAQTFAEMAGEGSVSMYAGDGEIAEAVRGIILSM